MLEAEALARYLERQHGRGALPAHDDRITVQNVFGEEHFDLVRVAQGVRWQRTR